MAERGNVRRRAAALAVVVAVLIAALLLHSTSRDAPPGKETHVSGTVPPTSSPPVTQGQADAPPAPPPTTARETLAKPPSATPAGWIEVHIVDAGGRPLDARERIHVYALPAGAPGLGGIVQVPNATVAPEETTRIPIAIAGQYDVGWISERAGGLKTDVEVAAGTTARVEFRLPPLVPAVFRILGEPRTVEKLAAHMTISTEGYEGVRTCPGRNDRGETSFEIPWTNAADPLSVPLPEGVEFRYSIGLFERREDGDLGDPWREHDPVPARGTVRAGGEVVVAVAAPAILDVRILTEPAVPMGCRLEMEFCLVQAGIESWYLHMSSAGNRRDRSAFQFKVRGIPGPAVLRWRREEPDPYEAPGVAFPEGMLEGLVLSADAPLEKEIRLSIDPAPALAHLDLQQPVRIDARLPDGSAAPPAEVHVYPMEIQSTDGTLESWSQYKDFPKEGPVELPAVARRNSSRLFVFRGPWLASDLLPFPATEALRADLRPTGLLRPEWDAEPGEEWGMAVLRRSDGASFSSSLLLKADKWVFDWYNRELTFKPGVLLGPLPEGIHTFEVRLGGVRLQDAVGVVKAGRVEPLRLRIEAPR